LTWSSSFNNWLPAGGSVTANTTTAPDGTMTADTLNGIRYQNPIGVNVWTFSCYAKANGGSGNFWLRVDIPATNETLFDLTNGTYSAPSGYTASIEDVGNGWYRCTMTTPSVNIINAVVVSSNYGTNETFIWGAQFEAGAYPTSYIPTTSASVTRNADIISKTGISSLIGQTEGVVFMDFVAQPTSTSQSHFWIGTSGSEIGLYGNSQFIFYSSGGVSINGGNIVAGTRYKVAFAYKANDYVAYINGTQVGTDTSASVPTTSALYLGSYSDGSEIQEKYINAVALWKTRLTNTQLAQLTTI
jgi:hypothetical protein